ncbi:unnamed protein product [Gordionus sp. m RMFG-2023]
MEYLKRELLHQKLNLDISNDVKDLSDIDTWFYKKDADCQLAAKPLVQLDLFASTLITPESLGLDQNDFIPFHSVTKTPTKPECSKIIDLPYNDLSFDYLESIKKRNTLTIPPENSIKIVLPFVESIAEYGHLINEALFKNQTSWILYDMATFYWRIKGEASKAIECVRRSLSFSSNQYKPIAMTNLANILSRAGYPEDALHVLLTIKNLSRPFNDFLVPYMLGNLYALMTNYTESIEAFRETLKLRPGFKPAIQRLHAVLCHNKLIQALEDQHNSLQQTLNKLQEFQKKHETWTKLFEKIGTEIVPLDIRLKQLSVYEDLITSNPEDYDMKSFNSKSLEFPKHESDDEDTGGFNYKRTIKSNAKGRLNKLEQENEDDEDIANGKVESKENDQYLSPEPKFTVETTKWHRAKSNKEWYIPPASLSLLTDRRVVIEAELKRLRKASSRDHTTFLDKVECSQLFKHFLPIQNRDYFRSYKLTNVMDTEESEQDEKRNYHNANREDDDFLGVAAGYMAPESKGWTETLALLNHKQGLALPLTTSFEDSEASLNNQELEIDPEPYHHSFPWKSPVCSDFGKIDCRPSQCHQNLTKSLSDKIEAYEKWTMGQPYIDIDLSLSKDLLSYIDTDYELNEEEVGQRILTALKMGNEKDWSLYNLAALYWRIMGNVSQSLECLHRSFYYSPLKYRIVPLFNMAALLAKNLRAYNHSLTLLKEASTLDKYDTKVTMLMAHLTYLTGNMTAASHYYQETLFLDAPLNSPHSINKEALIGFELVGCRLAFPDQYKDLEQSHTLNETIYDESLENGEYSDYFDYDDRMLNFETFESFNLTEESADENVNMNTHHFNNVDEDKNRVKSKEDFVPILPVAEKLFDLPSDTNDPIHQRLLDETLPIVLKPKDVEILNPFLHYNIPKYDIGLENDDCLNAIAIDFSNVPSTWLSIPQELIDSSISQNLVDECVKFIKMDSPHPPSHLNAEPICHLSKAHFNKHHRASQNGGETDLLHILNALVREARRKEMLAASNNEKGSLVQMRSLNSETGLIPILKKVISAKLTRALADADSVTDESLLSDSEKEKFTNKAIMEVLKRGLSIDQPTTSWVVPALTSLYWRANGNTSQALACLYLSLSAAPDKFKASSLVSLANLCHKTQNYSLAIFAIKKALLYSPKAIISHFTMANMLAAQGDFENALLYYASTISLQDFTPARVKLQTILCFHVDRIAVSLKMLRDRDEL